MDLLDEQIEVAQDIIRDRDYMEENK